MFDSSILFCIAWKCLFDRQHYKQTSHLFIIFPPFVIVAWMYNLLLCVLIILRLGFFILFFWVKLIRYKIKKKKQIKWWAFLKVILICDKLVLLLSPHQWLPSNIYIDFEISFYQCAVVFALNTIQHCIGLSRGLTESFFLSP